MITILIIGNCGSRGGKMHSLLNMETNKLYRVQDIQMDPATTKHLNELGIIKGSKIALAGKTGANRVVLSQNARLAINESVLGKIFVDEIDETETSWSSLDLLEVGEKAKVVRIYGTGAVKRRLMDMGLTRGTEIFVRKLAPLGDPIEINVRGYELSLRKDEASQVLVQKEVL